MGDMLAALALTILIAVVVFAAVREADPYLMRWADRSDERARRRAAERRARRGE